LGGFGEIFTVFSGKIFFEIFEKLWEFWKILGKKILENLGAKKSGEIGKSFWGKISRENLREKLKKI